MYQHLFFIYTAWPEGLRILYCKEMSPANRAHFVSALLADLGEELLHTDMALLRDRNCHICR